MYNRFLTIPMIIIGICLAIIFPEPKIGNSAIGVVQLIGIVLIVIGLVWIFFTIIGSMETAKEQIERFKEVKFLQKKLATLLDYKEKVESTFKDLLTKDFPEWEKDLLTKFSLANEKDKEALLAMCPKVESGKSFGIYVGEMSDAMQEIRDISIEIEDKLKEISVSHENPWLWFKKPIPANIKTLLDKFEAE